MLWTDEYWKKLRGRMIGLALSKGVLLEDAEDMANDAVVALLEHLDGARNPKNYYCGTFRNLLMGWMRRKYGPRAVDLPVELLADASPLGMEMDPFKLQLLYFAAAVRHVVTFGLQYARGTTVLLLDRSSIEMSSVRMASHYLSEVLDRLVAAGLTSSKTRKKKVDRFRDLLVKSLDHVAVYTDLEDVAEPAPGDTDNRIVIDDGEGGRRELSGNASEAVTLIGMLFRDISVWDAIEHAVAVEDEVFEGRDRGVSQWFFAIEDEHPPEDDEVADVVFHLQKLFKDDRAAGEVGVTGLGPRGVTVVADVDGDDVMVLAPTGEQGLGEPLDAGAVGELVEQGFDPPSSEIDAYHVVLDVTTKDHLTDVPRTMLETLESYGWRPEDGWEWYCEIYPDEVDDTN